MRDLSIVVVAAAFIAATQVSSAADISVKAPPLAVAPVFSWTGCYVGANGGWVGSRDSYTLAPAGSYLTSPGANAPPNLQGTGDFPASIAALTHSYDSNDSGGLIGAQVGCNRQLGSVVLGVEADWQWTSLETSADASYSAYADPGNTAFTVAAHTEQVSSKLEWFATLRGRVGYAFDRLLVFGTGGVAFANIKSETNVSFATFAPSPVYNGAVHIGSDSFTNVGWVVGAGLEYAFAPNWSVKGEYLYMDFGTHHNFSPLVAATAPAAVGPGYSWSTSVRERENVVRVGLNYKFYQR
jgi:outer membrane immunogenic protein